MKRMLPPRPLQAIVRRALHKTPPLKPTFGKHYRIVFLSAAFLIAR
jgi:hypothetical protein